MKIVIIEDEKIAAVKLENMVRTYDPSIEILAILKSVEESVDWFRKNPPPDLILLDIHLGDGYSFEIFEQISLQSFIIFTTAFDQYLMKAFKLNSVDYLLKPIQSEALSQALDKFKQFYLKQEPALTDQLTSLLKNMRPVYTDVKSRFVVRIGEKIKSIETDRILYFYAEEKVVFLKDDGGRKYIIDYTLDQLEGLLDPRRFFRLNRKYLVQIQAIEEARPYFGGRLSIRLNHCEDPKIIVSREKTHPFKDWMGM